MKNAAWFALALLSANVWLPDGARCQTSLAPPPAIIRASPAREADDTLPPKTAARRSAPPADASITPSPRPGTDYDGFIPAVQNEPIRKPPAMPRAANRPKPAKESASSANQTGLDYGDDDQLKQKLTICRNCK